jgi:hypothetical protein
VGRLGRLGVLGLFSQVPGPGILKSFEAAICEREQAESSLSRRDPALGRAWSSVPSGQSADPLSARKAQDVQQW